MNFLIDHFKYDVDKYPGGSVDVQLIISSGPNPTTATSVTTQVFKSDSSIAGSNELSASTDPSTFSDNSLIVTLQFGPDLMYFENYTVRVNIDGNTGDFVVSFCGHEEGLDLIPYRHRLTSAVVNKPLTQLDGKIKHAFCKIESLESMIDASLDITSSPDEGEYVRASLEVTLTCNDPEALIYYGVYDASDDTVPEQTSDNVYINPIELTCPSGNTCNYVIRCYAVKGGVRSNVFEFYYRLVNEDLIVSADPAPGTYSSTINVQLSCNDSTANIYYTTDGSDPDETSTLYTGPISVGSDTTIKAKAYATDGSGRYSAIYTFDYIIQSGALTANILASPSFDQPNSVTFTATKGGTDVTAGSSFYYTTDGSEPTTASTLWDGNPVSFDTNNDITIKVIAVYSGETSASSSALLGRRCPDGSNPPTLSYTDDGTTAQIRAESLVVPCKGVNSTVNVGDTGFQLDGYDIRFKVYYRIGTSPTETTYDDVYIADGGLPADYFSTTVDASSKQVYCKIYIYRINGATEEFLNASYATYKTVVGTSGDDTIDITVSRSNPLSADCANLNCCGDLDVSFAPATGATCATIEYKIESDNPASTVVQDWTVGTSYHIDLENIQGTETITIRARCQGSLNETSQTVVMSNKLITIVALPASGSITTSDTITLQIQEDGVNYTGSGFTIHYIKDGGTEVTVSGNSATLTFDSTGTHTLEYWITEDAPGTYCGRVDTTHKTETYSVAAASFVVTIEDPTNPSSDWASDGTNVYAKRGATLSVPISSDSSATIYYEEKLLGEACDDAATIEGQNTYSGPLSVSDNKKICAVAKIGTQYSDNIDFKEYGFVYADYQSGASWYDSANRRVVLNGGTRSANGSCYDWLTPAYFDITFSGWGINVNSVADIGITELYPPPCSGFTLVADSIVSSSNTSVTIRFRAEAPQECDYDNDGTQDRMKYTVSIPLLGGFTEEYEFQVRTGEDAYPGTTWCVYEVDEANSKLDYGSNTDQPLDGSGPAHPLAHVVGSCYVQCADGSFQNVLKWAGNPCDFTLKLKGSGITNIGNPSTSFTEDLTPCGSPVSASVTDDSYGGYDAGADAFLYSGTLNVSPNADGTATIVVVVTFGNGSTQNVTFKIPVSHGNCELGCESC